MPGQQEIIPFPKTWSELVAIDNFELVQARRDWKNPQLLKPDFLAQAPRILGLSSDQWDQLEQFYSDRCCFPSQEDPQGGCQEDN